MTEWLLGGAAPPRPRLRLRAGPLAAELEPDSGFLRYLRLGEVELLRGVYAAVRDHNWGTVEPRIEGLTVEETGGGFEARFTALCRSGEIDFVWEGTLRGEPEGRLVYAFAGEARRALRANRIGFCVLHPVSGLPGAACRVERVDGSLAEGRFPLEIAPHQPFRDVRALTHEAAPGVSVEVRMNGETFEMEDQRNWTDASYKTYCRPLDQPFPFALAAGERIEQSVEIRVTGAPPAAAGSPRAPEPPVLVLRGEPLPMPALGLTRAPGEAPTPGEAAALRRLRPAHLRVDLSFGAEADGLAESLAAAAREAGAVGAPLELALHLGEAPEAELQALAAALPGSGAAVARVLVFRHGEKSTASEWGRSARRLLAGALPGVPVGLGTDAFFAELNRERPEPDAAGLVSFSINPQVHASDEDSIVETLEAQAMAVRSARALSAGLPVAVSPLSLRMRFNPNATGPEPEPGPGELPPSVDPRQRSLFTAAWTVGAARSLAEAGAASVTLYETLGWRGVLEREAGSPLPARFPSSPGEVFPVYHAIADLYARPGARAHPLASSQPLAAQGLALRDAGRLRLVVANLKPEAQRVACGGLPAGRDFSGRTLDAATAEKAARNPERFRESAPLALRTTHAGALDVELGPYAVVTLDTTA